MTAEAVNSSPASVVHQFRRDIVNGEYNPRERLVEAELAERYGVSRSTMRAALLELTAEGLVEREPNRGARIRALSVAEGIEIAEVRRLLESLCARLAAERATGEERTRLKETVEEMRAAFEERAVVRYLEGNSTFHRCIHEASRHSVAKRILTQLGNLNFNRHFPLAFTSPLASSSVAEHEKVADAIVRGDAAAAEAAMYEHLSGLIDELRARADTGTDRR
jgi:DNA-binding GntR family transcriptional regulator